MGKGLKFVSAVHPQTCYVRKGAQKRGQNGKCDFFRNRHD